MKKLICIVVCISFLSGCLKTPHLKDRVLVQMVGIDYDSSLSKFKITLQVFIPEGGGGNTAIDSSKQNVKYIESEGTNLFEAINKAVLQEGKFLFYGDNRAIIIGNSAAQESLPKIMSYLNNDHESRANLKLLVTDGDASDIIKTPLGQGIIPADGINDMLISSSQIGYIHKTDLLDVGQAFLSSTISPVIPVITLIENTQSEKDANSSESQSESNIKPVSKYKLEGSAVFKDNKFTGYLNEKETRGLLFLTKKLDEAIYPGNTSKVEYSTIFLRKSNVDIKMTETGDQIIMNVTIKNSASVKEILLNSDINQINDADLEELEQNIASRIKEDCEAVINKAMHEYGVDIFYFGDIIWKSNPKLWKQIQTNQINYLEKIQVNYDIRVNINHVGLEGFLESE